MDGTILDGRLIHQLGNKLKIIDKIKQIQKNTTIGHKRTEEITKLLKGIPRKEIIKTIETIRPIKNLQESIKQIKDGNHIVGIISDSYLPAVSFIAEKYGFDFAMANDVKVDDQGNMTGEVTMPLGWSEIDCFCKISVCKRYHMENLAKRLGIPIDKTVAIGDTVSDLCMIESAGLGIAMMPKDEEVKKYADVIVTEPDASLILPHIL